MNEDLRVIKTQNAIKSAFLSLLHDKHLKDITVKEITDLAQCNRNTFYLHYTDKYDLMEKLCFFCLKEMERTLYETYDCNYSSNSAWYFDIAKRVLNAIESNLIFYKIVLGKNRYPDFANRYQQLMADFIYAGLNKIEKLKYNHFEVEFLASGMVGFLKYWLANQGDYSKEEVAKEMYHFVIKVGSIIFE